MYSRVMSGTIFGIRGVLIQVEADLSDGLPGFHMVGYLSGEVRESSERIRTAIRNSGYEIPPKRVVINLSPADIRKNGAGFDLPIAVAILVSMGLIPDKYTENVMFLGELGLNGAILRMNGVLAIVDEAVKQGVQTVVVPEENAKEAALIPDVCVIGVHSLQNLVHIMQTDSLETCITERKETETSSYYIPEMDFRDFRGQPIVRRAMEIAASGMHNLLMTGPPGAGKTMAAKCLTGILPELTYEESMEITKIYSVRGLLGNVEELIRNRPFRAPHHTITSTSLIGGGVFPVPGEITLAHHGVLFLDELPEFNKNVIEVLRQPLEDRHIIINRLHASYDFPADVMLICAMNPCPCGCYPDRNRCNCSVHQIRQYQGKVSRAMLDRMDLQLRIQPIAYSDMMKDCEEESSAVIRERVSRIHRLQKERYAGYGYLFNSQLNMEGLNQFCELRGDAKDFMRSVFERHGLSARGYHRLLKLSRTIADMDSSEQIEIRHLTEAAAYRLPDMSRLEAEVG